MSEQPESKVVDLQAIAAAVTETLTEHEGCVWEEVGLCVYCVDHGVRLYQGSIPDHKLPDDGEARRNCTHPNHVMDDDGYEHGQGFYWVCADCGFKGWYGEDD